MQETVTAITIIAGTHFIGAMTAFGSTLLALPLLAQATGDLHTAVAVLLILGTMQSFQLLVYTRRNIDWKQFKQILAWTVPFLIPGFLAGRYLPCSYVLIMLAVVLVASGMSRLTQPGKNTLPLPRLAKIALLCVAGFIHGAFACGGAALVVYCNHTIPDKCAFRATLSAFWVIVNSALIAGWFLSGIEMTNTGVVIPAIPVVLIASWMGNAAVMKVSERSFAGFVNVLLVVSGVLVMYRAIKE